jgi:hypothetical protein
LGTAASFEIVSKSGLEERIVDGRNRGTKSEVKKRPLVTRGFFLMYGINAVIS